MAVRLQRYFKCCLIGAFYTVNSVNLKKIFSTSCKFFLLSHLVSWIYVLLYSVQMMAKEGLTLQCIISVCLTVIRKTGSITWQ